MDKEKNMTPKQYLSQIRYCDELINTKLEHIKSLRASIAKINSTIVDDKVQSSSKTNFTDIVDKVVDLESELYSDIDKTKKLKRQILGEINGLDNILYKTILLKHYFLNKTLREISDDLIYDYNYIRHLHGWALQDFEKQYPEKFNKANHDTQ